MPDLLPMPGSLAHFIECMRGPLYPAVDTVEVDHGAWSISVVVRTKTRLTVTAVWTKASGFGGAWPSGIYTERHARSSGASIENRRLPYLSDAMNLISAEGRDASL